MDIVKDYKKVIEITLGEVVASPDFLFQLGLLIMDILLIMVVSFLSI